MEREKNIDLLKAILIALVVLGHTIQCAISDFDSNIVFRIIYSFHMPFFMFISGYLGFSSKKDEHFIIVRCKRLIVPYISWVIIHSVFYNYADLFSGNFSGLLLYFTNIIRSPSAGGLWFLWVLFLINVAYYLLNKTKRPYLFGIFFYLLTYGLFLLLNRFEFGNVLGISLFCWHFPFFIIGCYAKEHDLMNRIPYLSLVLLIPILIFLELIWYRVGTSSFGLNLHGELLYIYNKLINYLIALLAITVLFKLSLLFKKNTLNYSEWLSRNTLTIYTIHFIFLFTSLGILMKVETNLSILVALVSISTFVLSCFSTALLNMNRYLRIVFCGQYK